MAPLPVVDAGIESGERGRIFDVLARGAVGVLFVMLSINLLSDFLRTHHVTGLLLLVSEALVVVFTIARRPARIVDRSPGAAALTAISMVGPPLLRAAQAGLAPDTVTALFLAIGLCLIIAGKLALGRSFGLVPANRGVVAKGPYLLVRHPIYAGYLITHVAFLAAHPTTWNVAVVLCADTALVVRALVEEQVLGRDERYRTYCSRVAWHLVPGVF
jgi:protein-S-isoprenylcysteine O-methyltransferase Ste14